MHFPLALDIPSSIEKARSLQSHIHDMPEQDASVLLSLDAQYPVSIRGYALVSASSSPRWFPVYHFSEKLTSITVGPKGSVQYFLQTKNTRKKGILFMSNDTVRGQEPAWPMPEHQHVLQFFEQSSRDLCVPGKSRAGRPPRVQWSHLCMAIMLCFLRGWNAQLEVWRMISSEWVGFFAPVQVCDQAVYNRIERADTWMDWCFERVSAWLRTRLEPWEDRDLVPLGH